MSRPADTISVIITKPDAVVWQGQVTTLQSTNTEGVFEIMPEHARFLTILSGVEVVLYQDNQVIRREPVTEAVLYFANDVAKIFIQPTTMAA